MNCLSCRKELPVKPEKGKGSKKQRKFCNQKCHDAHKYLQQSVAVRKLKEETGLNKYTLKGLEKKLQLIEMFGGKCEKCGYDKNIAAFDFHHKDGFEKNFEIKIQLLNWKSDDDILEEALKCMLLCANCHRELHAPHFEMNHVKRFMENK